jgi:hypothetical protein
MPDIQRTRRLLARIAGGIDNRLNPVMAKEMYQSVHSRAFLAASWILLGAALLIYLIVDIMLLAKSGRNMLGADMGAVLFTWFYLLIGSMGLLILPLGAYFSLRAEIVSRTIELVQVTGIGAGRMVRGYAWAAAVRLLLLCSMLAPFAMLSYLFGGIDVLAVASYIYLLLLASLSMCALGLWCAALVALPGIKYFSTLILLGLLTLSVFVILPVIFQTTGLLDRDELTFDVATNALSLLGTILLPALLTWAFLVATLTAAAHMVAIPKGRNRVKRPPPRLGNRTSLP